MYSVKYIVTNKKKKRKIVKIYYSNILMAEFVKNSKNTYIFGLLALFATLYGPRLSPKLPDPVQNLFTHSLV